MPSRRVFLIAFWVFTASIVFSVLGTLALFIPAVAEFFRPYMGGLVQTPTWIYMGLLPVLSLSLYWRELGARRSVGFLVVGSVIGAAAELVGTQTGFPFGAYSYEHWLGPKIAGHVPYFIPPSWYALSIVSLDLARRYGLGRWGRIAATALLMVAWDVALDPAMNEAFPFWTYSAPDDAGLLTAGLFFGMPLVNWGGWLLTSAVIAAAYEFGLGGLGRAPSPFVRTWAPPLYALNLLFPIAVCFLYGLPWAGVVGLLALAVPMLLLRRAEGRRDERPAPVPV